MAGYPEKLRIGIYLAHPPMADSKKDSPDLTNITLSVVTGQVSIGEGFGEKGRKP